MFGISKRAITIVFGILAVAFILGSILLFTPQGQTATEGPTVMWVNNRPVSELDIARVQGTNELFSSAGAQEGLLKTLLDTYLLEQIILQTAVQQDASRVRVSGGEIRAELDKIKEQLQVKTREDYERVLSQYGYTDSQLREELKTQLQINKRIEQIRESAKITDEELRLHFELYKDNYRNEERVKVRQIVLDDRKTADDMVAQAKGGGNFAELAKANSKVGADQSGAVGAPQGQSDPQPVTRVVFPAPVADAVFAAKASGIVGPIEAGGRYYVVNVEEYLPAADANFDEAKARVETDVKAIKSEGAVEEYLLTLREKTQVRFAENSNYRYEAPVVAKVADKEIKLPRLVSLVFANPQVPPLLQQNAGDLLVQFLFPQALEQLINVDLAASQASALGQPFFGSSTQVATNVRLFKTQEVTVKDADITRYYNENKSLYTNPATAKVQSATFPDRASAQAFRAAALRAASGANVRQISEQNKGTFLDYGTVNPGGDLPPVANRLIFLTTGTFPKGAIGEVSEIVETPAESGTTYQVFIVNDRQAESVRPLAEVRDSIRAQLLDQERGKAADAWLNELKADGKVQNDLNKVIQELREKAAAAAPATPETPAEGEGTPAPADGQTPANEGTPAPANP